jgi:hypothetical protein
VPRLRRSRSVAKRCGSEAAALEAGSALPAHGAPGFGELRTKSRGPHYPRSRYLGRQEAISPTGDAIGNSKILRELAMN